jgi:hypothetical protein
MQEDGIYSEEEVEKEDIDVKGEVSWEIAV